MEKNNKLLSKITREEISFPTTAVLIWVILWITMLIGVIIVGEKINQKDQEIEELKIENTVLKEENQDIMGLWSDLVIEKE